MVPMEVRFISLGILCWEKEEAETWCWLQGELVSQEESSHRSDSLSEHLAGEREAKTRRNGTTSCPEMLNYAYLCLLFKSKPHVTTPVMDLGLWGVIGFLYLSLSFFLKHLLTQNKSPFSSSQHHSFLCVIKNRWTSLPC